MNQVDEAVASSYRSSLESLLNDMGFEKRLANALEPWTNFCRVAKSAGHWTMYWWNKPIMDAFRPLLPGRISTQQLQNLAMTTAKRVRAADQRASVAKELAAGIGQGLYEQLEAVAIKPMRDTFIERLRSEVNDVSQLEITLREIGQKVLQEVAAQEVLKIANST